MEKNDRNSLHFRLLESGFQQRGGDSWMAVMELREAFELLGAESRNASLAPEQLGEPGRELRQ
ncbi:MAG: hypothetical protein R3E01_33035 [Pirellulaceae bacterium]